VTEHHEIIQTLVARHEIPGAVVTELEDGRVEDCPIAGGM
jgi:hypothetical protein